MISWIFLGVTIVGALFTFNAYVPQRRFGVLMAPSFFAGWLTSEMALHHVAWQLVATVGFVWAGALEAGPGQLGMAITVVSWTALLALVPIARRAEHVVEAALSAALGSDYRAALGEEHAVRIANISTTPRHSINPFRFRHPDVEVIRDIEYVKDGGPKHYLDLYRPRGEVRGAPVLLQIHGGGWVIGNKREQALPLMNHLASQGWICVAANYHLSPKATFPDHLIDPKRAIKWIREEISGYGGDPNFIVVTGGSAGGHLSSLVGLTANDPEYQPGFESVDTSVQACVPFYGVYDWTNQYGLQASDGLPGFIEKMVLKKSLEHEPEHFRRASPLHRIHDEAPPFYVIHGSHDSLASVEEARHFAHSLTRVSDEPVAYAEIPGAQHAFEIFHSPRTSTVVASVDRFVSWVHARYLAEKAQRGEVDEPATDSADV
jgi:acetyl esterase/lipase